MTTIDLPLINVLFDEVGCRKLWLVLMIAYCKATLQ